MSWQSKKWSGKKQTNKKKLHRSEMDDAYGQYLVTPIKKEENIKISVWIEGLISFEECFSGMTLEQIVST